MSARYCLRCGDRVDGLAHAHRCPGSPDNSRPYNELSEDES
jgi:hypothetical protein